MPNVTLYNFETRQRTVIPLEELAPGWVKAALHSDAGGPDEIVWVNPAELKPGDVRHPPFDEDRRRLLREIQQAFREVDPRPLEEWELNFRRDLDPDSEITLGRWMAYHFKRLTNSGRFSLARKRELFQLLVAWVNTRNVEEVLATAPLASISEPEATNFLEMFRTTPLEFFGGATQRLVQTMRWNPRQLSALHYRSVCTLDEFQAASGTADVIIAIDYASGDFQVLFGCEHFLEPKQVSQAEAQPWHLLDVAVGGGGFEIIGGRQQHEIVFFALNFDRKVSDVEDGTEFEHICAAVWNAKGTFWVDFEQQSLS